MKTVLITGASAGFGAETARLLAKSGHKLLLVARRKDRLDALADECRKLGSPAVVAHSADLTDLAQLAEVSAAFAELAQGSEMVIINNAGVAHFGPFDQADAAGLDQQLDLMLRAPMHLIHRAVPRMLEFGGGQIINILSVTVNNVFPQTEGYSAAKSGLAMLGKVVSAEFRKRGIRVTNIYPGAADTEIWEGASFVPNRADMLTASAVAEAIRDLVEMAGDRNIDELSIMPRKGIL